MWHWLTMKKIGLPLIIFCNVSLAVHDDEHIERFKEEIRNIDEIMECYSTGGIYDFFVKVVLKDLDAYNQICVREINQGSWHREDAKLFCA